MNRAGGMNGDMTGGFVLVVGPSGAGKDTVIGLAKETLAGDPRFLFPRRLVTRPVSAFEDHDTIDEATFAAKHEAGRFALSWRAHGLGYAIPGETIARAREGRIVVINVSRTLVEEARARLPGAIVVTVTASRETLARRLAARARGEDGDLGRRLARSDALAGFRSDHVIENEGTAREAADAFIAILKDCAARAK